MQATLPDLGANYKAVEYLGSGFSGCVVKAKDIYSSDEYHEEFVAVKLVERGTITKYVERELINHSRLAEHPHIICFREVFVTPTHICLAMEYANYGTLFRFLRSRPRQYLDEPLARRFFQQLILAVDYCHQLGIVSRDIKLENILLTYPTDLAHAPTDDSLLIKLCDFGFSKSLDRSLMTSRVGTPAYMAPEVIRANQQRDYDGKAADVWSCGVTLFVMLYGTFPFMYDHRAMDGGVMQQTAIRQLYQRMLSKELCPPPNRTVSDDCFRLLCKLLEPDPKQRITAQQLYYVPWFNENLPPGTSQFNRDVIMAQQPPIQSEEEIRRHVEIGIMMPGDGMAMG